MSQEILNHINKLLENNKPKRAIEFCKKEIAKFTEDKPSREIREHVAEIYYMMSSIMASCGKMEEALHHIDNAIANNPKEDSYYYHRAEINVEIYNYENAIQDYSKSIKLNPTSVSYGKRGAAKILAGNYNGAVIDCTKAINMNPDFGGGYVERGRAKHKAENFSGAIKDFTKAIEMFPELSFPYGLRADSRIKMGDIEGALEDYKKLQKLDPRNDLAKRAIKEISKMNEKDAVCACSSEHKTEQNLFGRIKNLFVKR